MILGIDTATSRSTVAIGDRNGIVVESVVEGGAHRAEFLPLSIRSACDMAGISLYEVEAVVVDVGPGLFTGLRVGVSAAKSLAMALGIPAAGVCSLDALVRPHRAGVPKLVAALDARRGEVFAAVYREGRRLAAPAALTPAMLEKTVIEEVERDGDQVSIAGEGFRRYFPEGIAGASWSSGFGEGDFPSAGSVVLLGVEELETDVDHDPASLSPLYLRQADVRIHWETREGSSVPSMVVGASSSESTTSLMTVNDDSSRENR